MHTATHESGGGGSWSGGGGSAWGSADVAAREVTWRDLSWQELVDEAARLGRDERFGSLTDETLAEQVAEGAAQLDAALCRWLELVGELVVRGIWADQGARTPGQWLSWKLGIGRSTGRERVRVALALREFPATRDRFAAGTLSYSKVRAITRCGVPAEEELLLRWADDATAAQMERIARSFRSAERVRRDEVLEEEGRVRCSVRGRAAGPGRRSLTITGPVEDVLAIEDELRRLAEALVGERQASSEEGRGGVLVESGDGVRVEDGDGGPEHASASAEDTQGRVDDLPDPEGRGPRVTAADQLEALGQIVAAAAAEGTPPDTSGLDRHTVVWHASVEDLVDAHRDPGSGDDARRSASAGAAERDVDAEEVVGVRDDHGRAWGMTRRALRRLACDGGLVLVVEDRDGSPLDVGRRSRSTTAALRRALQRRDRGCTFPGCGATRHLHAHHVRHWADGGPTDLSNLVLVCGFHHRFVHVRGWHIEVRSDGRHRYRPPGATQPVERVGRPPTAEGDEVAGAAPSTASAGALAPPTYDGYPFDLDLAVAVLQWQHEVAQERAAARDREPAAA
jgi:hypothetical protein